jgi:hypothetical protein
MATPRRHRKRVLENLEAETDEAMCDAMEAALLFHSGGPWDAAKQARWLNYMVNHVCEPVRFCRFAFCGFGRALQGGRAAPLTSPGVVSDILATPR